MKVNLQNYIEIAQYAERTDIAEKLLTLKNALEHQQYLLAFMGQYSAGKSRLINNLLGKEILPTHINETTALITYLQYGEDEHAELICKNGELKACSLEDVKDIWQGSDQASHISEYDSIHLYVKSDLLENGMIIADTPGINTVFQPHIDKTVGLLESANRVVYLMAKTMTKVDQEFMECIHENGIETVMVRSKMDLLNSTEEDIESTVRIETQAMKPYTNDPVFFLSNDPEARFSTDNEGLNQYLFDGVNRLKKYLTEKIGADLKADLEKGIENKAALYAEKLRTVLMEKKNMLTMLQGQKTEDYEQQKKNAEKQLQKLNGTLEKNQKKLEEDFQSAKQEALRNAKNSKDKKAEKIRDTIGKTDFSSAGFAQDSFMEQLDIQLKRSCRELQSEYVTCFDRILGKNSNELLEELQAEELYFDLTPPATLDEAQTVSESLQERIDALLTLQNTIQNKIEESNALIAQNDSNLAEANDLLRDLQQAQKDVQSELTALGDYVPRYQISRGSHEKEQTMAVLGKLADIATILIPGEAWAKGAGMLTNAVKAGGKGAQVIKGLDTTVDALRILNGFKAKVSRYDDRARLPFQTSDMEMDGLCEDADFEPAWDTGSARDTEPAWDSEPARDTEYAGTSGKKMLEAQLRSEKETPGLLDFLSIEYYFRQLGKKMDTPDMVVEDSNYKAQFEKKEKDIRNRHKDAAERVAAEQITLLRIKDEKAKEEIHNKSLENEKKAAQQEIEHLKKRAEQEQAADKNKKCREYYSASAEQVLEDMINNLSKTVLPSVESKMEVYIESYGVQLREEIYRQSKALDELKEQFDGKDAKAYTVAISQCDAYLAAL